jgi:hydrogenase-4 membrane subunit HyfE
MPISATTEVVNASSTLGENSVLFSAILSVISSLIIIVFAFGEKKIKLLWWLLLSGTMLLWLPFVIYEIYFVGAKIAAIIDEKKRVELIIPKKPEVIDMNKPETP